MKVCTDACILGAWVAANIQQQEIKKILDIGCGTGLLSLMLAQKINAEIDAVEINKDAAIQATENISNSAWAKNLHVINTSLQDYITQKKYDLIICNPPFYEDDLRSADENKNAAKHDTTLRFDELLLFAEQHLKSESQFALLLPFNRMEYFEKLAKEYHFFAREKLLIKQSPKHGYFRVIILMSKERSGEVNINELIINDDERNYTDEFETLLKDYYLKL